MPEAAAPQLATTLGFPSAATTRRAFGCRRVGETAPGVGRGALEESEHAFIERCSAWVRAELARDDAWSAWIAEDNTGAVRQIWVRLIDKLPNPTGEPERHAYISDLYIKPSARGGVGTKLLESCLAWLAEQNVDSILLWPSAASRSLYERDGFTVSDDVLVLSGSRLGR